MANINSQNYMKSNARLVTRYRGNQIVTRLFYNKQVGSSPNAKPGGIEDPVVTVKKRRQNGGPLQGIGQTAELAIRRFLIVNRRRLERDIDKPYCISRVDMDEILASEKVELEQQPGEAERKFLDKVCRHLHVTIELTPGSPRW